jgi:YtkA-like protein
MKVFFSTRNLLIGILILLHAVSCKKESSSVAYPIPGNLKMINSGYATGAGIRVEVYAANDLFVGYNKLYLALYDSTTNTRITQAQISVSALMKMGAGINQSAPIENPTQSMASNGLFNVAAVFTMPTASNCNWTLTVHVEDLTGQKTGDFVSIEGIVQPSPNKAYSLITLDDSSTLFVCLVQPVTPQLGVNNFEVAMYKQINAMSFIPDSVYNVMIDAEMPSMTGMNSPNNVNPVYTGNGHYVGKVDFIMSGTWQVNVNLVHSGTLVDNSHYFNLNL